MKSVTALLILGLFVVTPAAVVPVSIVDFAFVPDTVTVGPGDTVRWTNDGAMPHSSTSGVGGVWNGLWDSGILASGESYGRAFDTPGTFPYYCSPHYLTMAGVVVVASTAIEEGRLAAPGNAVLAARPNPFNAAALIDYRVPAAGPVRLEIADAAGRLVRTLSPTGDNGTVRWDGTDGAGRPARPGVYLARLTWTGGIAYARMVKTR
ncbi:MAG: plastocyanin/azurin family copper-binding protein [bacterium]